MSVPEKERLLRACNRVGGCLSHDERQAEFHLRDGKPGEEGLVIFGFTQHWLGARRSLNETYLREVAAGLKFSMDNLPSNAVDFIVAERLGQFCGAALMVKPEGAEPAIRLLYVHMYAIDMGLEDQLIDECEVRAERRDYRTIGIRLPNHYLGEEAFGDRYLAPRQWRMVNEINAPEFGHGIMLQNWKHDLA
jgi:hypothetical protein